MIDSISIPGLLTSLFLPWLCGAVWVLYLLRPSHHWNRAIVAGHGYLLGMLTMTLLLRLWDFFELPLHFWSLAAALAGISVVGAVALQRQPDATSNMPSHDGKSSATLQTWQIAVIALLAGLILYRYFTLFQEMIVRPLFPWDAWMNWAPKAVVWFHYNDIFSFVSPTEWLDQAADAPKYTLGNQQAWKYPVYIPLIQFWGMLGIGTSDHPLIYLPWLFVILALGLALYGHLRLSGSSPLAAMLACYILLNLPYINVHTVLSGYADLWLAAAFGLATFALHSWQSTRHWSYAFLTLFLAAACFQIKVPGIVLGIIIILVFLLSLVRLSSKLVAGIVVLAAIFLATITTTGIAFELPGLGQVTINSNSIELPYFGSFFLKYHAVHTAFVDTLFLMKNWNMLWYGFILTLVIFIGKKKWLAPPSPELALLFSGLLFIFFTFYFTRHYSAALKFTTLNRALLYLIPSLVFYLAVRLTRLWQQR